MDFFSSLLNKKKPFISEVLSSALSLKFLFFLSKYFKSIMVEQSEEAMLLYYKRLFPYGPYFRWLNYGNCKTL